MSARALPPEAGRNQALASDPSASAWVSANAGTGKTAVLVKRSLRLLLAGFKPESILCDLHKNGGGGDAKPPAQGLGSGRRSAAAGA
jgi:hypothetical protein